MNPYCFELGGRICHTSIKQLQFVTLSCKITLPECEALLCMVAKAEMPCCLLGFLSVLSAAVEYLQSEHGEGIYFFG